MSARRGIAGDMATSDRPSLLVLIPDRISDILTKGEYQPSYYNPGGVFGEVHILSTTPDAPDMRALQRTVGAAKLSVHYHPDNLRLTQIRPEVLGRVALRRWAQGGVEIARQIQPDLIRCHGADWNAYLASRIKAALGVPYLVSLHINPDVNAVRRYLKSELAPAEARHNRFYDHIEREGLLNADLVMPVYEPILPYLARLGVKPVKVCYNVLSGPHLTQKADYCLGHPPRIISVGRLLDSKDPSNIIRAVSSLADVELLIVGDGPKRPQLERLAADLGVTHRVKFAPAIPNDELCRLLPSFDLFAVHTEYWEVNKSVLEALLTGLPVVINRRQGKPVPEFVGADFLRFVDNSQQSYRAAFSELLSNDKERERLGRRAYAHAQALWAPDKAEAVYAGIYRDFLRQGTHRAT